MSDHEWFFDTLERIFLFLTMVIIFAGLDSVIALPLMFAWNYVMPAIFGLGILTYGMSFCLLFVLTVLWRINII